jgi:hypothetical protein
MKKLVLVMLIIVNLMSCADSKEFTINGKKEIIEPYGWFDLEEKHDSIVYKVNTGNVVLSIIFCETVIAPILLTGNSLWEPIKKVK